MNYLSLYNTNEQFRAYVDRYCRKHRLTVDVAIQHRLVINYGDYIMGG